MVKVRFAPSPTGYLHIGGARTALFNWLYARSSGGKFVLRIEDTDTLRSKKEYLEEILYSLTWLGLAWDELYYQSKRFDLYREYAKKLVSQGAAYYSAKKIDEEEESAESLPQDPSAGACGEAIVYKVAPGKIKVTDLIRGEIEFDSAVIKDQVLIKSDGSPTYNFACVVDDATMGITHVIRGDDHISNTPKQVILYRALGFDVPAFAHLPLILSKEGGRLSKRKGATAISEFRQAGYLPRALVNYLLLLGWSPGANKEMIGLEEAQKLFKLRQVNKTAAVLDLDKLDWLNNEYIKKEDPGTLADLLIPMLQEKGYIEKNNFDRNFIVSLVKLFQSRLTTLCDFLERADFFFLEAYPVDPAAEKKFLSADLSKEFALFIQRLEALPVFDTASVETAFRAMARELNLETKALVHPIRVALTGKTVGPGLFEVIYFLGKERVRERLMRWVTRGS